MVVTLDGKQVNTSIKDLRKEARHLEAQFNKTTDPIERAELKKKFQGINNEARRLTRELRGTSVAMGKMSKGGANLFKGFLSPALGVGAVIGALNVAKRVIGDTIKVNMEFEKSMSSLKSITGATADDMEFYKQQAIAMGSTSTKTASEVAEAFKIIGSQKPELLENSAALAAVTKETITLAEAAEISIPEAAAALTTSLNQFNLGAEESGRMINVLAAGSLKGAGDINYLSDAMKRFGPSAAQMNISVEQSAAVMELFAEKGLGSEKAGTQFRNMLVTLASGADDTNPEIVGLQTAIENLGAKQMNTAELAKIFGKENLSAAQILSNGAERVEYFTDALTGTSTAYDQAAINTDNLAGDMKGLESAWEAIQLQGGGLNKVLRALVQFVTQSLLKFNYLKEAMRPLFDAFKELSAQIGATITAFTGVNTQFSASEIFMKALAGIVKFSTVQWRVLISVLGFLVTGFQNVIGFGAGVIQMFQDIGTAVKGLFLAIKDGDYTGAYAEFKKLGNVSAEGYMQGYRDMMGKFKVEGPKVEMPTPEEQAPPTAPAVVVPTNTTVTSTAAVVVPTNTVVTSTDIGSDTRLAEFQKVREQMQAHYDELSAMRATDEENELASIYTKYGTQRAAILENELLTREEKNAFLEELDEMEVEEIAMMEEEQALLKQEKQDQELADKEAFLQQLHELTKSDYELQKEDVNAHYDHMVARANKYGLDTTKIEEARAKELQRIENENNRVVMEAQIARMQATLIAARSMMNAMSDLYGEHAQKSAAYVTFSKMVALAEIAFNQGKAIASALAVSQSPTPDNVATGGLAGIAKFVSISAAIFSGIGQAVAVVNRGSTPSAPGFMTGGYTGSGARNQVAGEVHRDEYVVPSSILHTPKGMSHVGALEAMRTGSSVGSAAGNSGKEIVLAIDKLSSSIKSSQQQNSRFMNKIAEAIAVLSASHRGTADMEDFKKRVIDARKELIKDATDISLSNGTVVKSQEIFDLIGLGATI